MYKNNENNNRNNEFKIGEVYLMRFDGSENEQSGWRPGIVFQNNTGNHFSPNIIALPLTTSLKNLNQPTHVVIRASETGLLKDSMALCENPERMSKNKIGRYIATLPDNIMSDIAVASLVATSAIAFLNLDVLIVAWQRANMLNSVKI